MLSKISQPLYDLCHMCNLKMVGYMDMENGTEINRGKENSGKEEIIRTKNEIIKFWCPIAQWNIAVKVIYISIYHVLKHHTALHKYTYFLNVFTF